MTLRLFVAIPVPEEIGLRLVPLQRNLNGASWRPPENFHLTLRFFGEIDEANARDLDHELGLIAAAPFEMRLKGAGSFGGREPSAVWAGVDAPPALARLAAACEKAARRAGLPPEGRAFRPHVTLAYLHGTTDVDVAAYQQRLGAFETDLFWADHFAMYSSWSTKHGSRYVEEAVYPLTGAAGG
jgi:2'-5' RNA ligase